MFLTVVSFTDLASTLINNKLAYHQVLSASFSIAHAFVSHLIASHPQSYHNRYFAPFDLSYLYPTKFSSFI